MGIFDKIFGIQNLESQKKAKFRELERQFVGDSETVNSAKVAWLTSRGNHYGQQNQLDQAIADFKDALILNPNYTPAYLSLGLAYRAKGMFKEAITIFEKVPKESKAHGNQTIDRRFDICFHLGLVHMDMGDKRKAIEYLENSLKVNDEMRQNSKTIEQSEILKKIGVHGESEEGEQEETIKNIKEIIKELKQSSLP